ncbi:MAG TPA: histidine phosphatase family protein [Burkholderiaceae bacterium]|jgi:alpha-ribazole phosphatase
MKPQALRVWRHPRPQGAEGRCIGARSDLPVHWRRAKRLARRIQATARRERLPHVVWTSPLQRCADIGRWLHRWGWTHHRDAALLELDFGAWDGRCWSEIAQVEIDAWVTDFADHAPGGGESLRAMLQRVASFEAPAGSMLVSHGGWMLARRWLEVHGINTEPSSASEWPAAPRYACCLRMLNAIEIRSSSD